MNRILLTSVAAVALLAAGAVNSADAADLARKAPPYVAPPPPPPVFSWTGCFVGTHWGWGWGRKTVDERNFESEPGGTFQVLSDAASGKIETSGAIFGGQVGCDYQFGFGKGAGGFGAWVIGIQGDAAGADINGFTDDPFAPDSGVLLHVKQDWLASVTGRIGWAGWTRTLIYFKGGGAWAHDRWDLHASFLDFGTDATSQSRSGWTVGAGVEWAFLPNWSAFIEWDHYDFGTKNVATFTTEDRAILDAKQRDETVKIGINYRFNFGKGKAPVVAQY